MFPAPLKDISLNGWNAVVANNMTATFLVSKEVYLRWMEQKLNQMGYLPSKVAKSKPQKKCL